MMNLKIFNKNMAGMNSYVLYKGNEAICIDPGFNGEELLHFFASKGIKLTDVILTHGHYDHMRDINELYGIHKFRLYVHKDDMDKLNNDNYNYSRSFSPGGFILPDGISITTLGDEERISFAGESLNVIHTPGHTSGSICIKYQNSLFSGDTLFYDSIGRTDLVSGNMPAMNESLKKLLKKTGNKVTIYPGHGKHGKFDDIRKQNRFLSRFENNN